MMNRIHNAGNPHQGPEPRVLCLCSAGLLRSPTTAAVMWQKGFNTRAAGVETDYALIPVDEVLIQWADIIIVMERWQAERLLTMYPGVDTDNLYVFAIPDCYPRNSDNLIALIEDRVDNMEDYNYELLKERTYAPAPQREGELPSNDF